VETRQAQRDLYCAMVAQPVQDSAELAAKLVETVSMAVDSRRERLRPEEVLKRMVGRSWHRSAVPVRWARRNLGRREEVPVPLSHFSPLISCLKLFFLRLL